MRKKLQVFVSSTFTDLQDDRQAAVEAILRAGHIPAGMELFAAGDSSQWDVIRKWIDDSDVFMLILGGRYGTIKTDSEQSYIELEYDYATQQKKPIFAAVIDEALLKARMKGKAFKVVEELHGDRLKRFKEKVTARICRTYKDTSDLKVIVFESLGEFAESDQISGWIRRDEVNDPKAILDQLSNLQHEIDVLRRKNELLSRSESRPLGSRPHPSTVAEDIDAEPRRMLIAAKDSGMVTIIADGKTLEVQGGSETIDYATTHRGIKYWKQVVRDLLEFRVLEGSNGEYELSSFGYLVVDEIEKMGAKK